MSKITTNSNGIYIPTWVQAACSNPRARAQRQCRVRTGIIKAILIHHKEIESAYGPIQRVTSQVASVFLFSLAVTCLSFYSLWQKGNGVRVSSVKLLKAKLQVNVWYAVVAVLWGWWCGKWTRCLHVLQCSGNERQARITYAGFFSCYCQPQNCSVLHPSISVMAQFDDELEQNLLHTDSQFSFLANFCFIANRPQLPLLQQWRHLILNMEKGPRLDKGHRKQLATRFLDC